MELTKGNESSGYILSLKQVNSANLHTIWLFFLHFSITHPVLSFCTSLVLLLLLGLI